MARAPANSGILGTLWDAGLDRSALERETLWMSTGMGVGKTWLLEEAESPRWEFCLAHGSILAPQTSHSCSILGWHPFSLSLGMLMRSRPLVGS